ncbi:MAG: NAD(P)H-dependent oxidoreductase [Bacteroidota bacterium]
MSLVALLGSARSDGHAAELLDLILAGRPAERFDLAQLDIREYVYDAPPEGDDFLRVAEAMTRADDILMVTPVYWYAMSSRLKRFFDRMTDLVTVRKPIGRALAGRTLWMAACGSNPEFTEGFEVPFRLTADYLDMTYGGAFYASTETGGFTPPTRTAAAQFGAQLFSEHQRSS